MMSILKWTGIAVAVVVGGMVALAVVLIFGAWVDDHRAEWRDGILIFGAIFGAATLFEIKKVLERISNQLANQNPRRYREFED